MQTMKRKKVNSTEIQILKADYVEKTAIGSNNKFKTKMITIAKEDLKRQCFGTFLFLNVN